MRLQSDCDTFWFLIFYSTPASHEPRNYLSQYPLRCVEEALLLSQLPRHTYHTLPKYILPYLVLTRCVKGFSLNPSPRGVTLQDLPAVLLANQNASIVGPTSIAGEQRVWEHRNLVSQLLFGRNVSLWYIYPTSVCTLSCGT
jgi:hypothetical protein